ncbi:MAG: DNA-directed RNA polymerase subunit omega [Candidatus Eisenbacteria bacterium]|uniref:DNA-directed RNA polymerase subunit omega n=1 Tax=Eiseniibacteriota bacterium TaxID=2212470 RepID=A0A538TR93_UNCEI|nr:MAG: DNA-directed RNA polymerase subunit omega [Candidatus Eisenbacteria bacterium]
MTKLASLITPPGMSKYELAIVAAREARRLNEWSKRTGETIPGKVTVLALERTLHGEVAYSYED